MSPKKNFIWGVWRVESCKFHSVWVTYFFIYAFAQDDIYEVFNKRYTTIDNIPYDAVHDFFTSLVAYKHDFKVSFIC